MPDDNQCSRSEPVTADAGDGAGAPSGPGAGGTPKSDSTPYTTDKPNMPTATEPTATKPTATKPTATEPTSVSLNKLLGITLMIMAPVGWLISSVLGLVEAGPVINTFKSPLPLLRDLGLVLDAFGSLFSAFGPLLNIFGALLFVSVLAIFGIVSIVQAKQNQDNKSGLFTGLGDFALAACYGFTLIYTILSAIGIHSYSKFISINLLFLLLGIAQTASWLAVCFFFAFAAAAERRSGRVFIPLAAVSMLMALSFCLYDSSFSIYTMVMNLGQDSIAKYDHANALAGVVLTAVFAAVLIPRAVQMFLQPSGQSLKTTAAAGDAPSGGFAALSFFVPLAGLIFYIVWRKQYPQKAKSCSKGALIGAIVAILLFSCMTGIIFLALK